MTSGLTTTADVVIIGGGCMGASVAFHLARLGMTNVILVEREPALGLGSTGRNAGGVRHQFSHEANVRLSIESIRCFERFSDDVGAPIDFHQDGYLFLLSRPHDVDAFGAAVDLQRRLGVEVDWVPVGDLARLSPGLDASGILAATFCARDGICDPHGVTSGYAAAAQRAGVTIWRGVEATGITTAAGRVTGVDTSRGPIATPVVVNAAGPWARAVGRLAGIDIPVDPLRRHIFVARPPEAGGWAHGGAGGSAAAPDTRVMVIDFETGFYFHREGANLLFGMGDPDEPFGFDVSTDWRVLERVAPVAARRLPALAELAIARAWAGLYEMTPDAMPILGPAGDISGHFVIAGFSGHGFQHAPAAGRILADVILDRDPGSDLAPFGWNRFSGVRASGEGHVV